MSRDEEERDEDFSQDNPEESELDEEQTEETLQRQKIRENLSTLSFEELLKLKEKVGSKIYNETVYGVSPSNKPKREAQLKRVNKNRPREVSAKIRPKQLHAILSNSTTSLLPKSRRNTPRDPRFDPQCGEFDKTIFKKNYEFINELKMKEKAELQKEYRECTDPDRKKTIRMLVHRIENQVREEEKTNKEKQKDEHERTEVREKMKRGEKPIYKNKSVKKLESLVEKYEELKKSNRLEKHIQKRAKKLKVKDMKKLSKIK